MPKITANARAHTSAMSEGGAVVGVLALWRLGAVVGARARGPVVGGSGRVGASWKLRGSFVEASWKLRIRGAHDVWEAPCGSFVEASDSGGS